METATAGKVPAEPSSQWHITLDSIEALRRCCYVRDLLDPHKHPAFTCDMQGRRAELSGVFHVMRTNLGRKFSSRAEVEALFAPLPGSGYGVRAGLRRAAVNSCWVPAESESGTRGKLGPRPACDEHGMPPAPAALTLDRFTADLLAQAASATDSTPTEIVRRLAQTLLIEQDTPQAVPVRRPEEIAVHLDAAGKRTRAYFDPRTSGVRIASGPLAPRWFRSPGRAARELAALQGGDAAGARNGWQAWVVSATDQPLESVRYGAA